MQQDKYLEREVECGDVRDAAPEEQAPAEVVEQVFEPETGKGLPELDAAEIPVPDVEEDLDEDDRILW